MASHRRKLEKRLSYQDLGGSSQEAHAAHWRGFTFTGGRWKVSLVGPWGAPQVWASTPAEGRRVLLHVAAIAGYDMGGDDWEWIVQEVGHPRYGREVVFALQKRRGLEMVSKRAGPSGSPVESVPP